MEIKMELSVIVICALLNLGLGYPNGAPNTDKTCLDMTPDHSPNKPQAKPPPYDLVINKESYTGGDTLTITISSQTARPFQGFFIQARRVDPSLNRDEPIGYFATVDGTQTICSGSYGNALTHVRKENRTNLKLSWTSTASSLGHIQFWITLVADYTKYWAAERSGIIMDRSAPPLSDATTREPTTPPFEAIDTSQCGTNKGCFRHPAGCEEAGCDILLTWRNEGKYVVFEMSSDTEGWVAFGLSDDQKMGNDDVTECVWNEETSMVEIRKSFNEENARYNVLLEEGRQGLSAKDSYKSGGRVRCRFHREKIVPGRKGIFDLNEDYHLFLAKGNVDAQGRKEMHSMEPFKYPVVSHWKVSLLDNVDVRETRYILVKVHACLMLFAWMMCCTTAILLAKYYKPMWPNENLCNEKVWFAVHRSLQSTNLVCTVIAFIIIFVHVGEYSWMPELPGKAHPILGIITTCLCVLNPLIALCRCKPEARKRPIFNWIHWFIGTVALVLSTPTIFIGLNLPKAHVPSWVTWVVVAFLLWHLIMELLLEIHGCMNSKKQKMRNEEFEMRKKTDSRGDYYGLDPEPVGTRFKKTILALYLVVAIILGLVVIITVAVS